MFFCCKMLSQFIPGFPHICFYLAALMSNYNIPLRLRSRLGLGHCCIASVYYIFQPLCCRIPAVFGIIALLVTYMYFEASLRRQINGLTFDSSRQSSSQSILSEKPVQIIASHQTEMRCNVCDICFISKHGTVIYGQTSLL